MMRHTTENSLEPKRINAFIVGAQKAGTTSLNRYLSQHPDIFSYPDEFGFFYRDELFTDGYAKAFQRYYRDYSSERVLLGKNIAVFYSRKAMKRLHDHNPSIKIILMLRNPVDRAYSAFKYTRQMGWEDCEIFETAIEKNPSDYADWVARESCEYLRRGRYHEHFQNLLEFFPMSQIFIGQFSKFISDPNDFCQSVFDFFGIQSFEVDTSKKHNIAKASRLPWLIAFINNPTKFPRIKKLAKELIPDRFRDKTVKFIKKINAKNKISPPMNASTRARLNEYFKPYNEKLEKLLRIDLSDWNK